MKILLVALNSKFVHSNLAIRYIKAFSQKNYDIDIFEATINENLLDISIKIAEKNPDIVGFSCYIWNIESTLKICSNLKEINKDIKIVLGGPEVSYDGSNVLKKYEYIDFIIQGEGEVAFKELLDSIHDKGNLNSINGLIYREGEKILENNPSTVIENLDILPFPYSNNIPDKIVYYEASRGCPFKCKYCLSSTIKGVRYFSINRVKRDLKFLIDNRVKLVKFVDRTFNANKKFAMEIWDFLIKNAKETKFHFEIAADLLDDEAINLLKKVPADLFQFEIGIQTTNEKVLKNINRVMDFNKVKNNVIKIMELGNIHCHLDLIAGLPGEDFDSFKRSFDMCMELNPDVLQLGFLKVLKGSPVYFESNKYGIKHIKYPPYQVLYTGHISFNEMQELLKLEEIFEVFYNSKIFDISISFIMQKFRFKSKFDVFMEFKNFLEERGFFNRNFDLKDKFKALYEFCLKFDKDEIIRSILTHDFIINTKKHSIPDFLRWEYAQDIKNKVYSEREKIIEYFGDVDFRKIAYTPTNVKVRRKNREYEFEKFQGICIFSLEKDSYCYIK